MPGRGFCCSFPAVSRAWGALSQGLSWYYPDIVSLFDIALLAM